VAKPFVKGDPRINRKGRPRSFDALRALARQIANEVATSKAQEPIVINGHVVTVAEMILRNWARDAKLQAHFIEIAYGKVPDSVEFPGALKVLVEYADHQTDIGAPASGASADQ
jgi:hypothetical protein